MIAFAHSHRSTRRAAKRTMLAATTLAALLGVGSQAWAARCDNQSNPVTIAETQQMNYGKIAVTNGGGTVTIAASGSISAPGGFTVSGITAPGKFRVTGKQDCVVSISFLAGSLTGPGTAMTIQNFTTNAGANPTLDHNNGILDFNVGADLLVNSSQTGGSYSGTYSVTVIY
jgi:hypothetical protein